MSPCLCYENVCLGGGNATEGNLFVNEQPICDDYWTREDAEGVCRQIGLAGGTHVEKSGYKENYILITVGSYFIFPSNLRTPFICHAECYNVWFFS